jgi:hypothetical protein
MNKLNNKSNKNHFLLDLKLDEICWWNFREMTKMVGRI